MPIKAASDDYPEISVGYNILGFVLLLNEEGGSQSGSAFMVLEGDL